MKLNKGDKVIHESTLNELRVACDKEVSVGNIVVASNNKIYRVSRVYGKLVYVKDYI